MTDERCQKCGAAMIGQQFIGFGYLPEYECGTIGESETPDCLRRQLATRDKTIADLKAAIGAMCDKWDKTRRLWSRGLRVIPGDDGWRFLDNYSIGQGPFATADDAALAGLAELRKEQGQ